MSKKQIITETMYLEAMMGSQKIVVVTDSSAYIPESAMEGLDISVIPLWLIWEGKRFRDGVDIDPKTFYDRLKSADTLPTSSQPSAKEFETFFRHVAEDCDAIVSVLVSSKISGTVACAQASLNEITDFPIRIVDTLHGSMGAGLAVLEAARAAASGASINRVAEVAKDMCSKVELFFVVDTLEYLHRGGRIGTARRYLATILNIKPILQFKDGLIGPLSQARTKKKAIDMLLSIVEERLGGKNIGETAVVDIDSTEEGDALADLVSDRFHPSNMLRAEVSPVVGTHVGPGGLGIAFYPEG
jgi:DegV family protein with EDD domain